MSESRRKFLVGVVLWLLAGAFVGWLYGYLERGLLAAALLALVWQVRQLLSFDEALHSGNFDAFRMGEGIWQQIFSRFHYEHERGSRYKSQYRRLLREIRASTDAMPDGAIIIDSDNEIVLCNRAAKSLAGIKRKKDRGQRIDNILRDPALVELLHDGDFSKTIEIASPMRDGAWLNCRVVPYGADQKLLILRDITERIQLLKMRRDFVANASHELRSPLTVVSGYLDGLADDPNMPTDWAHPVAQMQRQATRMKQIVSELIELSRLEVAGRATIDEFVDVEGLLFSAMNSVKGLPNAPTINIEAESTSQVRGSASEIQSVISNLLSNAIRHTTPDGTVTLTWRSNKQGGDLIVSDTGEGIAEEHVSRLTERFFRVDRGRSRDDGGIGLGLAIVKHILSRHDAELIIGSEFGVGSEFRCHIPADRISS